MRKVLFALPFVIGSLHAIQCKTYTPPECPEDYFKKDSCAITASAEFLFWTVEEGALDYALDPKNSVTLSPSVGANGNYQIATFDWDPGFRVALSYFNAPRYWEILGQYTWLYSSGTDSTSSSATSTKPVTGTFSTAIAPPLTRATSRINIHYNLADLLIARVYLFQDNAHLRVKLFGGLTGTWIDQDWEMTYTNSNSNKANIRRDWDYWGIGFRAGLSFDWFWMADFFLTGKYSTALLVGRYCNQAKTTSSTGTETPFFNTEYEDTRLVFTTQFLIGPSYQKAFTNNRLEIFAGYELTIWGNLHEVFRSDFSFTGNNYKQTILNTGLVGLHGLTARITVDF